MEHIWNWLRRIFFGKKHYAFELVDNLDKFVETRLKEMLTYAISLDIAVGYFHISGYSKIEEEVQQLLERGGKVRVILGNLRRDELTRSTARLLLHLIEMSSVEVRTIKPRRLHTKLFLAQGSDGIARILLGSSNLTKGGLLENIELNAYDIVGERNLRATALIKWFEDLWATAVEVDKELLEEIIAAAEEVRGQFHPLFVAAVLKDLARVALPDIGNFAPLEYQLQDATSLVNHYLLQPREKRGFLLAHEVGLGKTLIAGMTVKTLISQNLIQRVLAVVPLSIQKQWQKEMKLLLDLDFDIVTPEKAKRSDYWHRHRCFLISYDLLRQHYKDGDLELIPLNWDFVVLDESHFVRNRLTKRWKALSALKSKFTLLMTATPMHNTIEDLLSQMVLFVPDTVLERATAKALSRIDRKKLFQAYLHRRLQKRELKDIVPNRQIKEPQVVSLSDGERKVYERLKKFLANESAYYRLISRSAEYIIPFIKQVYLEQFVSSKAAFLKAMQGLRERIEQALERGILEYNFGLLREESQDALVDEMVSFVQDGWQSTAGIELVEDEEGNTILRLLLDETMKNGLRNDIAVIGEIVENVEGIPAFAKEKATVQLVKSLDPSPMRKIVLFVGFISTGEALRDALFSEGISTDFFHGDLSEAERDKMIGRFRKLGGDDRIDVLITTDAAYVGLNLQVANFVIHHDLSWNPMVVEQRIGRVHRIGQRREVVSFSLLAENTIDLRKHEVLLGKLEEIATHFGLSHEIVKKQVAALPDFSQLVGSLELGELSQEQFEQRYRKLVAERRDLLELLQDLEEGAVALPVIGECSDLISVLPDMIKALLSASGREIGATLEQLDDYPDLFLFRYRSGGETVSELATLEPKVFIAGDATLQAVLEDYEKCLSPHRNGVYYLGPYHPAISALIQKLLSRVSERPLTFIRTLPTFPSAVRQLFPTADEVVQINYFATLHIVNPLANIEAQFELLVPILVSPKDGKAEINAKAASDLAFAQFTAEERWEDFEEDGFSSFVKQRLKDFAAKQKNQVEQVTVRLSELEAEALKAAVERQAEEWTRELQRLADQLARKKSQGLSTKEEERKIGELQRKLNSLRPDATDGYFRLQAEVKNLRLLTACRYRLEGVSHL